MTSIVLWIIVTVILFIFFGLFILLGIRRKRMKFIYISIAFFLLTVVSAIYTAALATYKAYQVVRGSDVRNPFDKRTGIQIYADLFDQPLPCVSVTHSKDQKLTELDFSLWMKFQTCGAEVKRIVSQKGFQPAWNFSFPEDISRPGWFNPTSLGDSSTVLIKQGKDDKKQQVIFLSKDSTQGLYGELGD